jgi:hypothetical protein
MFTEKTDEGFAPGIIGQRQLNSDGIEKFLWFLKKNLKGFDKGMTAKELTSGFYLNLVLEQEESMNDEDNPPESGSFNIHSLDSKSEETVTWSPTDDDVITIETVKEGN